MPKKFTVRKELSGFVGSEEGKGERRKMRDVGEIEMPRSLPLDSRGLSSFCSSLSTVAFILSLSFSLPSAICAIWGGVLGFAFASSLAVTFFYDADSN